MSEKNVRFTVDRDACVRCGECAADCVVRAIEMSPDGPVLAREDDCIGCQHCLAICPKAAVSVFGLDPAQSISAGPLPEPAVMRRMFAMRRSVRRFRDVDLPRDCLEDLVAAAWDAPTAVNARGLHFAVVGTRQAMDEVRRRVYDRLAVEFARPGRGPDSEGENLRELVEDWQREKRDHIFRDAPAMVVASCSFTSVAGDVDAVIALSYLELQAAACGVGATWCGFAAAALKVCGSRRLLGDLGVARGHRPAYAMLLGLPAVEYPRAAQRGAPNITYTELNSPAD